MIRTLAALCLLAALTGCAVREKPQVVTVCDTDTNGSIHCRSVCAVVTP